jgi:hypothetical protein
MKTLERRLTDLEEKTQEKRQVYGWLNEGESEQVVTLSYRSDVMVAKLTLILQGVIYRHY